MKKEIRQEKIYHFIKQTGETSVKKIAQLLNVSEMTVRRDLTEMETGNFKDTQNEYSLIQALKKEHQKKFRIGEKAASLIGKNETIIIDIGSTTSKIIPYLDDELHPVILTYNSLILFDLISNYHISLKFCGGQFHSETGMFESQEGIDFLKRHRATKYFASASGIHETLGVTCMNDYETGVKKASIISSLEVILMADSSKFGVVSPAAVCGLESIHSIITDAGVPQEWIDLLEKKGINLIIV